MIGAQKVLRLGLFLCGIGAGVACSQAADSGGPRSTTVPNRDIRAVVERGTYHSVDKRCQVELDISGMGGGKALILLGPPTSKKMVIAEDVTGFVWVDPKTLTYSVSPIYGKPGLFRFDCESKQTEVLVAPRTKSASSPDGSDYFELEGASSSTGEVCYFYGEDVEKIDFKAFRSPEHLRCSKWK